MKREEGRQAIMDLTIESRVVDLENRADRRGQTSQSFPTARQHPKIASAFV